MGCCKPEMSLATFSAIFLEIVETWSNIFRIKANPNSEEVRKKRKNRNNATAKKNFI